MNSITELKVHRFHGGIHPPENKKQSLASPVVTPPLPEKLVIPVTQPGYREPEILVEVGQQVLKGQVIARGKQLVGVNCHASSSGTVTDIAEHPVPNASGLPDLCITIETDGRDEWLPHEGHADYTRLEATELINIIHEAGISGLGGAGFPTHIKLAADPSTIDTLIINACECEPFITADDSLMQERASEIVTGIQILMQILGPERCLIGIEDNKPEAIQALEQQTASDDRLTVITVPTLYPSGSEKQLIYLLTGQEVPSGGLPAQLGIVCQNVGTAYAIKKAVTDGEPLVSRITTVTGAAVSNPCNMDVRIGTLIPHLLAHAGLDQDKLSRVIMGGSLMGVSLADINTPVLKITNCLIATTEEELPLPGLANACIRCGMCTEACPANLLPQQLYWFARSKEHDKAREHNLMDCIECGACAYVCPSKIPLVQYYRMAKGEIREEQEKHRKGELSQQRFEFHESRVEKEKALQEERRRKRAELAKKKKAEADAKAGNAQETIQAALERVKAKKGAGNQGTEKSGETDT